MHSLSPTAIRERDTPSPPSTELKTNGSDLGDFVSALSIVERGHGSCAVLMVLEVSSGERFVTTSFALMESSRQ